ncbi:MAG: formylglycine-generating enzyme family protein [Pseudomonadota bacterium]
MSVLGWLSLVLFGAAAHRAARRLALRRWADFWIAWLVILTGAIVATGQVLSLLERLSSAAFWLTAAGICAAIAWRLPRPSQAPPALRREVAAIKRDLAETAPFTRAVFRVLAAAVLVAAALNLVSLFTCRPTNWDSIASHLTRAAYFLQFDSLKAFDANYWAHDAHAHNAAILWVFVLGILQSEILVQAIQFVFYLGGGLVVYGLGRELLRAPAPAAMGAFIFLLLVENLLEAISVQNDLVLHFYSGAAVYFLLQFARQPGLIYGWLSVACMFLTAGVKGTVIMHLPVWTVVGGFAILAAAIPKRGRPAPRPGRGAAHAAAIAAAVLMAFFLGDGMGYLANVRAYGHPIAPVAARDRSFENTPTREMMTAGAKNLFRYGFDFFSLDGLNRLPGVRAAEVAAKRWGVDVLRRAGVNLEGGRMHVPFSAAPPATDEDFSWWGIMGFLLIPAGVACYLSGRRGAFGWALFTAGAAYIFAQAFVGPYGPWRGRYFLFLALLWAPFAGSLFMLPVSAAGSRLRPAAGNAFLSAVVALGVVSAIMAAGWRDVRPITLGFAADRLGQMTARFKDPQAADLFRRFNAAVPPEASVVVCLPQDFYEYLLFGEELSRKLTPIRHMAAFEKSHGAPGYLFYRKEASTPLHLCPPRTEDFPLGDNYFLRRLGTSDPGVLRQAASGAAAVTDVENHFGMRFRQIPAGDFEMGSPPNEPGRTAEETRHRVTLPRPFFIQTREVTRRQWATLMGGDPGFPKDCPDCPVNQVSWEDIQSFIRRLNESGIGSYRLPTEAEWEVAARAGTETAFAGGPIDSPVGADAVLERAGWYVGNAAGRPWPVGSLAPNAWGLYDMHGNVWEWCADGYGPYSPGPAVDPRGDPAAGIKVVRGGSYDNQPFQCRSAMRNGFPADHRAWNLGFRLVYVPGA